MQKGRQRTARVLATLFEQKVCDFHQLKALCFGNLGSSMARKILAKMKDCHLVETNSYSRLGTMPINLYSLSPGGYKQLAWHCDHLPDYKQIKSNYREHDLALSDIRIAFQYLKECEYFLSENVLRSKILESSSTAIANIRTVNADAAILLNFDGAQIWSSVEYERSLKSNDRYIERFKRLYSNSDLKLTIFITENQQIQDILRKIESEIYPNIERKVLFGTYNDLISNNSIATVSTTSGVFVDFHKDKNKEIFLPTLQTRIGQ